MSDSRTSQRTIINIALIVIGLFIAQDHLFYSVLWFIAILVFNRAITTTIATKIEDRRNEEATRQYQIDTEKRNSQMAALAKQQNELNTAADAESRRKIYRTEIIRKLNSANNYLEILGATKQDEDRLHIKQLISDEICEIIAKHPMKEFIDVVKENSEIQAKLRSLDARMNSAGVTNEDLALMISVVPKIPS